jgi:regulator of sirC expression with transglutaminase-like and TPR domain
MEHFQRIHTNMIDQFKEKRDFQKKKLTNEIHCQAKAMQEHIPEDVEAKVDKDFILSLIMQE